jgi:hypothetical protein
MDVALLHSGLVDETRLQFTDALIRVVAPELGIAQEWPAAAYALPDVAAVVREPAERNRSVVGPAVRPCGVVLGEGRLVAVGVAQGADALQARPFEVAGQRLPALAFQRRTTLTVHMRAERLRQCNELIGCHAPILVHSWFRPLPLEIIRPLSDTALA